MAEQVAGPEVLLLGGRSQIGVFVIPRLLAAGYRVRAVSRQPDRPGYPALPGLEWVSAEAFAERPGRAIALVSAGPLVLACHALRCVTGLQRAVVFSTSSVVVKRDSTDTKERRQMQGIAEAEDDLRRECLQRRVGLCLLRPTLVYGCGLDRNVSRLARWLRRWRFLPVAGSAAGLRQPVHADDLAQAAVAALALDALDGREPAELFLCGGSTLSYGDMVRRIGRAIGVRAWLLPLPTALLAAFAALAGLWPGSGGIGPAMVRRQGIDLVFDDGPARQLLGFSPRPFEPRADDFRMPGEAELRALARQPAPQ